MSGYRTAVAAATPSQNYDTFGGSTTFPIDQVTGDVAPGADSIVKGDWAMPVPWTITLGQPQRFSAQGNPLTPPRGIYFDHGALYAFVEWGFGGTNFQAEVDWRQGCAFGVTGTYVRVSAIFPFDEPVGPDATGQGITVGATAVPNASCAAASAYRTVFYGDLAAADFQNRYIPAFAYECLVRHNAGNPATSTYELEWSEGGAAPVQIAQEQMAVSANRNLLDYGLWTPVPFEANWAGIRNTSASLQARMRIIYRLSLG
jgi:hypothetical protein